MHGVCLIVAYDGSQFAGFQRQPEQRTIQSELERAAGIMSSHAVRVRGAGRTDAGVHALAQVVAFDSARSIPPRGWLLGLNRSLPDAIRVQRAVPCPVGFAPRFEATEKTYRYLIQVGEIQNPLLRHQVYALTKRAKLDLERMRSAARMLTGTHDYRAFRGADDQRDNSVRTLYAIEIEQHFHGDPTLLAITVRGTAFMKNMVRILVGTLIDVARGRIELAHVEAMLGPEAYREQAGHTAPAAGLTLLDVQLGRHTPSPFAG